MKKLKALALLAMLAPLCLTSCGGKDDKSSGNKTSKNPTTQVVTEDPFAGNNDD